MKLGKDLFYENGKLSLTRILLVVAMMMSVFLVVGGVVKWSMEVMALGTALVPIVLGTKWLSKKEENKVG